MKSSIILLNTRLRRTVTILRFKLLDTITVCFEKSVLYFGMGEPLTSACKKCLSSIPIPFRTLCWLCFVQSLVCPYFGILAENPFPPERGYITGATAPSPSKDACSQPHKATMQGRIMTAAQSRCTMQRHKWLSMHRCSGTNG